MNDLVTWLRDQLDVVARHRAETLKVMAYALPAETGAYLTEVAGLMLAEVDAKRRILDAYTDAIHMERVTDETGDDAKWDWLFKREALEGVVKLLALPYADRPGYRDDWKP